MLVCYLDDSGKRDQSQFVTVAGYISTEANWLLFEEAVEYLFRDNGIPVFHAVEMYHTKGPFKGWSVLRKQSFISQLCTIAAEFVSMGICFSVHKNSYQKRAVQSGRKRTITPHTYCIIVIMDSLLRDTKLGKTVNNEGVKFLIEEGHQNNKEAIQRVEAARIEYGLQDKVIDISEIPKNSCRAIQLSDLLAYYGRRDSNLHYKATQSNREHEPEQMMKIVAERPPLRGFTATNFFD